jgi:uncharacterized protein (DUF1800 family)
MFPEGTNQLVERRWEREVVQCGAEYMSSYASTGVNAIMAFCRLCAGARPGDLDWVRADIEPYYRCFVTQMLAQGTLTPTGFPDETGFGELLEGTKPQDI